MFEMTWLITLPVPEFINVVPEPAVNTAAHEKKVPFILLESKMLVFPPLHMVCACVTGIIDTTMIWFAIMVMLSDFVHPLTGLVSSR